MNFNVAAVQMNILSRNQEANLAKALSLIEKAAKKADIICLPELFTTGFDYEYITNYAAPIENQITTAISERAKELKTFIIAGSIPEKTDKGIYNTSIFFDDNGEIIGKYRKLHLFPLMEEDKHFIEGSELPVFDTPLGKIGIMLCYDLRFPEVARKLALSGAELIFVPAEFPQPRIAHWQTLLHARAIENQVYIVGVNRIGKDSANIFFGNSCVINPWGDLLATSKDTEFIVKAEIDISNLYDIRKKLPCLNKIRTDFCEKEN